MGASWKAARLVTVAFLVSISMTFPQPASASEWDEVEFVGSGWGHGVGMSQHGARAMAAAGKDYHEILAHYFQGTSTATLPPSTTLWVNLERNFANKTLRVRATGSSPGSGVAISSRVGSTNAVTGATITVALVGSGCTVDVANPGISPVTLTDLSDCSFDFSWYPWSTPDSEPTTKIEVAGCTLPDWNTPGGTAWRPCEYARGTLHLRRGWDENAQAHRLHLSAEMLMDDYVQGISEVPLTWPADALRAQAVAARSYAEARRLVRLDLRPNYCWCHLVDTTGDQRYVGWGHVGVGPWIAASDDTAGEVLTHPDSSLGSMGVVAAYYSSSSGGATEYGHLKGFASGPVEWLSSVDDGWSINQYNPNASWTVTKSADAIADLLGLEWLSSVEVTSRRPGSGSAETVEFRGMVGGQPATINKTGAWVRSNMNLKSDYFRVTFRSPGDELFFYRGTDGSFRYYDILPSGSLGAPIVSGSGYSMGWSSISAVDLDGDGQDELFFYRATDGTFRYYDVRANGSLGAPILSGSGYSKGWSSITAVDLDGDNQDELFFYRATDGVFRYYHVRSSGSLGAPILSGSGYSKGWSSITAVDLDGDGQDELFFYRGDGTFRYYEIAPNAALGSPILSGDGYSNGWSSITSVDLDGQSG